MDRDRVTFDKIREIVNPKNTDKSIAKDTVLSVFLKRESVVSHGCNILQHLSKLLTIF